MISRGDTAMIGTLLRFLVLRVIGARAAAVLAAIALILGRRRRRAEEAEYGETGYSRRSSRRSDLRSDD